MASLPDTTTLDIPSRGGPAQGLVTIRADTPVGDTTTLDIPSRGLPALDLYTHDYTRSAAVIDALSVAEAQASTTTFTNDLLALLESLGFAALSVTPYQAPTPVLATPQAMLSTTDPVVGAVQGITPFA